MGEAPLDQDDLACLPIFPLPRAALFPGVDLGLHVFEPRYRELLRDALAARGVLALMQLKPGFEGDYAGRPPVFEMGCAGRIVECFRHADGRYDIKLRGLARVRILDELPPDRSYRVVRAEVIRDRPADPAVIVALQRRLSSIWVTLSPHLPEAMRDLGALAGDPSDAGHFADRLAAALAGGADFIQCIVSESDPCERLHALTEHVQMLAESVAPLPARPKAAMN